MRTIVGCATCPFRPAFADDMHVLLHVLDARPPPHSPAIYGKVHHEPCHHKPGCYSPPSHWECHNKHDPELMPYCGYEGRVLNMLHSPIAKVHTDRFPLYAPAVWIGRCYANGTTKEGWTHEKFTAHLAFLDTVGITRIGIWCQNSCAITNISNPLDCGDNFVGFFCAGLNSSCPYVYEELTAWKARTIAP